MEESFEKGRAKVLETLNYIDRVNERVFLQQCEKYLFTLIVEKSQAEVYRAGIQDMFSKRDYFDIEKVASAKVVDVKEFVAGNPQVLEQKLQEYIRPSHERKHTSSICVAPEVQSLVVRGSTLTDDMASALLSIGSEELFECNRCHKRTMTFRTQQKRSKDEMATEIRYCTNCKE
jgi:DNA-directed RNA polymerase subunit M/transcription elongation factor TFIIS